MRYFFAATVTPKSSPFAMAVLVIIILLDILVAYLSYEYIRKGKYAPPVVLLVMALIINIGFYGFAKIIFAKNPDNKSTLNEQEQAPSRNYPYITKHTLERDISSGTIYAVDEDGTKIALARNNPRQVFQDSLFIVAGKENTELKDDASKLDYAKFAITLYYGETDPDYVESAAALAELLKGKTDNMPKQLGASIEESNGKNSQKNNSVQTPAGYDWDLDGKRFKFDSPEAAKLIGRISKPKIDTDYDGAKLFRLYTYSLKYNELAEWQFKVFNNGEIWIKQLNCAAID